MILLDAVLSPNEDASDDVDDTNFDGENMISNNLCSAQQSPNRYPASHCAHSLLWLSLPIPPCLLFRDESQDDADPIFCHHQLNLTNAIMILKRINSITSLSTKKYYILRPTSSGNPLFMIFLSTWH